MLHMMIVLALTAVWNNVLWLLWNQCAQTSETSRTNEPSLWWQGIPSVHHRGI